MSREDDLRKLIIEHNHQLQILKQQAATFGLYTPPYVQIGIENIEKELEKLQAELDALIENNKTKQEDLRPDLETSEVEERGLSGLIKTNKPPKLKPLHIFGLGVVLIALLVAVVFFVTKNNDSFSPQASPTPTYSTFCIRQSSPELMTVNNGTEIEVKPEEPLILSLCTPDGIPVLFKTCYWKSSSTGHIDNPDGCVDVIYHAPKSDPDILTLTVSDTSRVNSQLSLTIIVKP